MPTNLFPILILLLVVGDFILLVQVISLMVPNVAIKKDDGQLSQKNIHPVSAGPETDDEFTSGLFNNFSPAIKNSLNSTVVYMENVFHKICSKQLYTSPSSATERCYKKVWPYYRHYSVPPIKNVPSIEQQRQHEYAERYRNACFIVAILSLIVCRNALFYLLLLRRRNNNVGNGNGWHVQNENDIYAAIQQRILELTDLEDDQRARKRNVGF